MLKNLFHIIFFMYNYITSLRLESHMGKARRVTNDTKLGRSLIKASAKSTQGAKVVHVKFNGKVYRLKELG